MEILAEFSSSYGLDQSSLLFRDHCVPNCRTAIFRQLCVHKFYLTWEDLFVRSDCPNLHLSVGCYGYLLVRSSVPYCEVITALLRGIEVYNLLVRFSTVIRKQWMDNGWRLMYQMSSKPRSF